MCETEYAEGGAKLHHPAQDRVNQALVLISDNKVPCAMTSVPFRVTSFVFPNT